MSETTSRSLELLLRFRRLIAIGAQLLLVVCSNWLAFWLRFDDGIPSWAWIAFLQMLPWLVAVRALAFIPFRLYQGLWRYTSLYDLRALVLGIATSSIVFYLIVKSPLGPASYPRSVLITDALVLTILMGGLRMTHRLYTEYATHSGRGRKVLVFGAGNAGELIVRDMKNNPWYDYHPIGFVDDNRSKVGGRIHGVPVLGTRRDLRSIIERYQPDEVLIAMPRAEPAAVRGIVRALEPFKVPIKTLPNLRDIINGKVEVGQIRSLAPEDLLSRAPVGLDSRPLRGLLEGRRVMVTGAGGSIGSELCRQIATFRPASLIMLDRYENTLHAIRLELADQSPRFALHAVIGDVADAVSIGAALRTHKPEIVFHAAAHKHVPLMEENPCEAIKNNVRGTRILAEAADQCGVDRFILISTDKAVNPTSVMGASKRVAELLLRAQSLGSGTSFSVVRFGNVLASNGSVVPRFLSQIKKGGPVTVTHPDMRRFFMLIPEAVQLVLHAAAQAHSGATYVLEMGEQVKLVDMARDLIRLSGFIPDQDISISFTGLRGGEKLFEELVANDEEVEPSEVEKILRVTSRRRPNGVFSQAVLEMEAAAAAGSVEDVMQKLRQLLPEYATGPAAAALPEIEPMDEPRPEFTATAPHQRCPHCAGALQRSHAKGLAERIKKELSPRRPFRCVECGWRGWRVPVQYPMDPVDRVTGPDLVSLDSFSPPPVASRRSFSPRDLQ